MNWHAVAIFGLLACVLLTVGVIAAGATAAEYDPPRKAALWLIPLAVVFAADALLVGVVFR
jgi:hypothetical protein